MKNFISYARYYDLYVLLIFVSVISVGLLGIYPSYTSYSEKVEVHKSLEAEASRLDATLRELRDKRYLYEDIAPYVESLNIAIPTKFTGETIITEMVIIASRNGFLLNSMNFGSGNSGEYVDITISLEGDFFGLESFISDLENNTSSIVVDNISSSFSQRESSNEQTLLLKTRLFTLHGKD